MAVSDSSHKAPAEKELMRLRREIETRKLAPEETIVRGLGRRYRVAGSTRFEVEQAAVALVERVRKRQGEHSLLDVFLSEFGLSNEEGVALMCLAETLLRVPDKDTIDALISEKMSAGNWNEHLGQSPSLFVNASTWAMMLTGQVVSLENSVTANPVSWFKNLTNKLGEPIIRMAIVQAMRILAGEFVMGRTISEAIERGKDEFRSTGVFSYDMLGEGARTDSDAAHYFEAYEEAINAVGIANAIADPVEGSGISVKLSALHPRHEFAQRGRVLSELCDRIQELVRRAASLGIGLTIDAEEADRLDLSLDVFEILARQSDLWGWDGLGLAVQAYGKRAFPIIHWIHELSLETGNRFSVRLVKGAYWDAEIKHAQELGLEEFSVFTRKASTDLSYLVCAKTLLEMRDQIYPQFATHNAHTVAAIMRKAPDARGFEFQRLHGMGKLLYDVASEHYENFANVRIYAPVGGHEDLLAYLVRRLLENGANNSFVNRFLDEKTPARELVRDPAEMLEGVESVRHPNIRLPSELFGGQRQNSKGFDLSSKSVVDLLTSGIREHRNCTYKEKPLINGDVLWGDVHSIANPADTSHQVGTIANSDPTDVGRAAEIAHRAQEGWDEIGGDARAGILERTAELLEENGVRLIALLVYEAGKTIPDASSELREAIDFCRYYAAEARRHFGQSQVLGGPTGELNKLSLHGRGVFACISPWNFPLAIFIGQVTAALAAGNAVIAKPAEQTPLIAAEATKLLRQAGVPSDVLYLVPGDGATIGQELVRHPFVAGVAFTGSTAAARSINLTLACRDGAITPLIAETGGQNVMFVDSTALLEQVADDVIQSAFLSAGQRCSSLRVLYLQEEIADRAIDMISGAMQELHVGDPSKLSTDIGPIIDKSARQTLEQHISRLSQQGALLYATPLTNDCCRGHFVAPHLFEIESINELEQEHFGPILHVIRYRAAGLDQLIEQTRCTGYGLTLGVHSRIEERASRISRRSRVGNTYVNRNMVGAVVGVQPFGGQGLSGTGPKAGGPHYLPRFATEKTMTVNTMAIGGNAELLRLFEG